MTVNTIGVHEEHCCQHGCKYGDPDCPVESGKVAQKFTCESVECPFGNESTDELAALRQRVAELEAGFDRSLIAGGELNSENRKLREQLSDSEEKRVSLAMENALLRGKAEENAALREQVAVARKALVEIRDNGENYTWDDIYSVCNVALADTAAAGEGEGK